MKKGLLRFTYNEHSNIIMTVAGRASGIRGSGVFLKQAAVSCVQINRSEQKSTMLNI